MNDIIRIPHNGWKPRKDQMRLWRYLQEGGKRAVEVAHRRWGKDEIGLQFTACQALQEVGNYWHMLPEYGQARKAIWNAVNPRTGLKRIDEIFPPEIRRKTQNQEMYIEFVNGSSWQMIGSDNYNSTVGSVPRGIVLSEWSIANPLSWAYLSPILEENKGWALFIYTSRGNNHGKTTYEHAQKEPDWFAERLTAEDTEVFKAEQLKRIKHDYMELYGEELGVSMYNQEYLCSFSGATLGAYFATQINKAREDGRITKVKYTAGVEVDTYWDLGVDDSMTIWLCQKIGNQYHFIDYVEGSGYGLPYYVDILKSKNYKYGNHYMPHDAAQREMTNSAIALSRKEVAEDLGLKPVIIRQRAKNMDVIVQVHIPAIRSVLPMCWFDENRCKQGLLGLENYHAEYSDKLKKLGNRPAHDWSSHPADAFRTFAISGTSEQESIYDFS